MVSVKELPQLLPQAGRLLGLMLVMFGVGFAGGLMMKAMGLDRPLLPVPVAGFRVITVALPGLATRAAATVAVNQGTVSALPVVTVGGMGLPFPWATVFAPKAPPFTVHGKTRLAALGFEGEKKK